MKKQRIQKSFITLIILIVMIGLMGCGGDRTQDGDSRIEGGCSTISTGQKSEKYC